MFISKDYDGSTNTVAFKEVEAKSGLHRWHPETYCWSVPGLWISKAQSTRGALVYGQITFSFNDLGKEELPTFQHALHEARDLKNGRTKIRTVNYDANVLIDDSTVWGAGYANQISALEFVISTYRNLPNLPEGWDGWYSQSNR